ncbi:C39 family peptidase [bacterium]|nr:MAG: C39 family peptidase [bacterium]
MITRPQQSHRKPLLIVVTIMLLFGIGYLINKNLYNREEASWQVQQPATSTMVEEKPVPQPEPIKPIPPTLALDVPFTPQAPTANWDELHNEACEEASAIMAYAYFNDIASLPASYVETKISELTQWQTDNYGYYLSINNSEMVKMLREAFDLKAELVDMSEEAIKRALTDDKLVILPANGQMLGNPNFTPPGPIYHMLVIKGFNTNGFITNDPGTRRGKDYFYTYETLYNSNGNWSHTEHKVDLTDKQVIIVSK